MSRFLGLAGMWLTLAFLASCTKTGKDRLSDSGPRVNPCTDDVQKFCGTVEKGEGRVIMCLEEHQKELTPACQAFNSKRVVKLKELEEKRAKRQAARDAKKNGAAPPVCTAEKPCPDDPAKAAAVTSPAEEAKMKMAKGEKASKSKETAPTKKK